jgi:formate hydrogenlyase transcriptional activator
LAHGGTLFLDEVGEMPLETQSKLLRVLQDGMVDRLGGAQPISVDVRVIAATNADLPRAVKEGKFRKDLFYRLNVFPIGIPPLRNRPEDIPSLAGHFLEQYGVKLNRSFDGIEPESLESLIRYSWPGNVRELENVIERAMIVSKGLSVSIDQRFLTSDVSDSLPSSQITLEVVERRYIAATLASTNWRIEGQDGAAEKLGIAPSTLRSRIRKLDLQRPTPT